MHQCLKFILFWNDTLHVSDGISIHHHEFKTVHTATGVRQTDSAVCLLAIGICQTDSAVCLLTIGIYQTDSAVCLLASRQHYLFDVCLLLYVQS